MLLCDNCFGRKRVHWLHTFWKNNVYLQRLNGIAICVIFVYAMPLLGLNSERVDASSTKLQLPARAVTGAANAYTKRDTENSFLGT